jgi:hypothetical protein
VNWWRRKKHAKLEALEAYVAKERAEAEAVHDDTRRQAEETRTLRAESSRVHERAQKIREANHFTTWLTQALRGVQEDGR